MPSQKCERLVEEPSKANIMKALGEYKMFSPEELTEIEKEIAI
jgi:hypothetical protein